MSNNSHSPSRRVTPSGVPAIALQKPSFRNPREQVTAEEMIRVTDQFNAIRNATQNSLLFGEVELECLRKDFSDLAGDESLERSYDNVMARIRNAQTNYDYARLKKREFRPFSELLSGMFHDRTLHILPIDDQIDYVYKQQRDEHEYAVVTDKMLNFAKGMKEDIVIISDDLDFLRGHGVDHRQIKTLQSELQDIDHKAERFIAKTSQRFDPIIEYYGRDFLSSSRVEVVEAPAR